MRSLIQLQKVKAGGANIGQPIDIVDIGLPDDNYVLSSAQAFVNGAKLDDILMQEALRLTGGNRSEAAQRLGLGRNTLTRKLGSLRPPSSSD